MVCVRAPREARVALATGHASGTGTDDPDDFFLDKHRRDRQSREQESQTVVPADQPAGEHE